MTRVKRTSVPKRDHAHATRAIGRLLHDPNALETSFTDVVNTVRLFTEGDDDVDILQAALLRVFSSNLELRAQLLEIARRSHISGSNGDWHHRLLHSDTGDSEETDEPQPPLRSAHASQLPANQVFVKHAAPTVATPGPPKCHVRHNGAAGSEPLAHVDTELPPALASSKASAEELPRLLLQKLIRNLFAESTAPTVTGGTDRTPSSVR